MARPTTTEEFIEQVSGRLEMVDSIASFPRHKTLRFEQRKLEQLRGLVLHQSLGGSRLIDISRYHVEPGNHVSAEGCPAILYTFGIERDGMIRLMNRLEDVTWSQGVHGRGDSNTNFISVCVVCDASGPGYRGHQEPTGVQIAKLQSLAALIMQIFGWEDDIYGHCDFGKPACPGHAIYTQVIDPLIWRVSALFNSYQARQALLKLYGAYRLKVDGLWGPGSKKALAQFQRDFVVEEGSGAWTRVTSACARQFLEKFGMSIKAFDEYVREVRDGRS